MWFNRGWKCAAAFYEGLWKRHGAPAKPLLCDVATMRLLKHFSVWKHSPCCNSTRCTTYTAYSAAFCPPPAHHPEWYIAMQQSTFGFKVLAAQRQPPQQQPPDDASPSSAAAAPAAPAGADAGGAFWDVE